jgi:hypothetical protein
MASIRSLRGEIFIRQLTSAFEWNYLTKTAQVKLRQKTRKVNTNINGNVKANQVCGEIRRQKCNCNGKCSVDELRKQIIMAIDVEGVKLDEELKMKVCLVEGREKK